MLDIILHRLACLSGLVFLYCGLFLYEREENALHNRLDNCWKFLDLKGRKAVNYHADIIQKFAAIALTAINKICGSKVYSLQNYFATVCISIMSVASFPIIGLLVLHSRIPWSSIIPILKVEGITLIIFGILLLQPLFNWSSKRMSIWMTLVGIAWASLYVNANGKPEEFGVLGLISYFDWLILWIALVPGLMVLSLLSKMALNAIAAKSVSFESMAVILIYCTLITGTAITIKTTSHLIQNTQGHGEFYLSSDNLVVILFIVLTFLGSMWLNFALIIFFALSLLLLHSMLWGIIERPIYSLSRHHIFNQHKTLVGIGLTLIAYSIKIPQLVLDIIKSF